MKILNPHILMAFLLQTLSYAVEARDYQGYFPLQNGNTWHYRFEETETIYSLPDSIFGSVKIDGQLYYAWGDNADFPLYVRWDEMGRIFRYVNNAEKLWFDFTADNGEQYDWSPDENEQFLVTVTKNLYVMTYAGRFDNCIEFAFKNQKTGTEDYSYVFAPDIGVIKKQFYLMNMLLVTARVDQKYINRVVQTKPNVVTGFSLAQNYPNPFNATTFIRFALPYETSVSLEIYDIRGAKVRTLVAARQAPGEYITMWDGLDDTGRSVNSGIYAIRLIADDFVAVKRMVLLR